ncbi:MAG: hypothetical protein KDD64_13725 [Bdellovibrionales bacterium]|nr:hypothetical protein [Bdellovibrionales bacterium]
MIMSQSEQSKRFIQQSLECLAAYFVCLADGSKDEAQNALDILSSTDSRAEAELSAADFSYYRQKRSQLSKIFTERLLDELRDQVHADVAQEVRSLVQRLQEGFEAPSTPTVS